MIILFDIDYTLIDTTDLKDRHLNQRLPVLLGLTPKKLTKITDQYLASLNSSIEFSPCAYAQFLADKLNDDKQDQVLKIFLNNSADLTAVIYPKVLSLF